ncbi:MAG: hypothetical protein QNK36_14205 [Colwellia sp.]|nr:hypothetical protein [Colwellia sp.]
MFAASTCHVRAAALIKNLYDGNGGAGACQSDVQSGLVAMTPASSYLLVLYHLKMLNFATKQPNKTVFISKVIWQVWKYFSR